MPPKGHRIPLAQRFWNKVEKTDGCWLWNGVKNAGGYGYVYVAGEGLRSAHRIAYEIAVGPIPAGFTIDHVRARGCVHRHCVNPAHLEPVTTRENLMRGSSFSAINAGKTHCPQGHEYSTENTMRRSNGRRACKCCRADALRRRRIREPEKVRAVEAVARALKRGVLTRPDACEECSAGGVPEAHHEDYSQPLSVRWLCFECHRSVHADLRAAA